MPSRQDAWFIRVRLKPRQLLLLVAIDELGNIQRAADELGMTQPAASKLLKELEVALEVSLFDRLPRGMRPTWYGEIMIRHAKMTLANLGTAHDEITALKSGLSGQVAVGCIMPAGIALLPLTIARLKSHYPLLQIRVELDSSDALLAQLTDSKLDIAVARLFEHHDKSAFDFEPLAEILTEQFTRKGPAVVSENLDIARIGYDYAAANFQPFANPLPMCSMKYAVLSGNIALAMGGAAAGVKFYLSLIHI